jgi:hypothetical protein
VNYYGPEPCVTFSNFDVVVVTDSQWSNVNNFTTLLSLTNVGLGSASLHQPQARMDLVTFEVTDNNTLEVSDTYFEATGQVSMEGRLVATSSNIFMNSMKKD